MRTRLPAAFLVLLAACGSDGEATSTTVTPTDASPSTASPPSTSTTTITYTITDGVFSGPATIEVDLGDRVVITLVMDAADHLHVHGYDLLYELKPGEPMTVEFAAEVPGIFEVELESNHTQLFEIEVLG